MQSFIEYQELLNGLKINIYLDTILLFKKLKYI